MNPQIPSLQAIGLADTASVVSDGDAGIHRRNFVAGHILFRTGDARDHAYLIDTGTVDIVDEHGTTLCTLGPGEIFGEMALMDGGHRTAMARVSALSDIFIIPRTVMQTRLHDLDPMMSLLIGTLVDRYRNVRINLPESFKQDQTGSSNITKQKDAALKELRIDQDIKRGLDHGEFIPVLQPILSLPDRKVVGFEALVRWNHPERGFLTPNHFIPAAERSGMIQPIDFMMLRNACRLMPDLLADMGDAGHGFFVSVNLSGLNFETLDVIQNVREALVESEIDPHHIKLEITESALINDPERAELVLKGLKALGVTIALDDFGTGYSSLGYLHRFSIDALKIDQSFVSQIQKAPRSIDIIRAIVGLARNFKLGVVAEGIETEEDMLVINSLGCDMGQGYLFGKPMPVDDARAFIRRNLSSPA